MNEAKKNYWYECRYCGKIFSSPIILAIPDCKNCPIEEDCREEK